MSAIYLDYNATTPTDARVLDAMLPFYRDRYGNPSSSHSLGKLADDAVQNARSQTADLLGCHSDEVTFTSGGTESSNLAIQGVMFRQSPERHGHLVISAIEHPATVEPARWLEKLGFSLTVVGCDANAVVDAHDIAAAIRDDTVLVSVMHANNEVGSIQPIGQIAKTCREAGVLLHVDAAQSAGKIPVHVDALGADLLTLAGHKLYAPKGIGALYIRRGVQLEPVIRGANQEKGIRPGTENVAQIVGFGVAATLAAADLATRHEESATLRDRLQQSLATALPTKLVVHAEAATRLPNTLSVSFSGVTGADLLEKTDDLCASTGAACHSGSTRMSATLAAMGTPEAIARGTIRLSVGRFTTRADVDEAANRLIDAWRALCPSP